MDSVKRKQLAGSQAARMQSLAHKMQVWGTWPAAHMQSWASPFYGVANNGTWAAQMQSPHCGCLQAVFAAQGMGGGGGGCNTAHRPPLQTRVVAANGTVLQLENLLLALMILAHMERTGGGKAK